MVSLIQQIKNLDRQALLYCMLNLEEYKYKDHFQVVGMKDCIKKIGENNNDTDIFAQYNQAEEKHSITFSKVNPDSLLKDLSQIDIPEDADIYIGKNTLKTKVTTINKRKRLKETGVSCSLYSTGKNNKTDGYRISNSDNNIFALRNIVIDIDCHYDLSEEEWKTILSRFLSSYEDILEYIPLPTVVDFSGRGFHIWYNLESASAQLSWLYKIICDKLCDNLQKAVDECLMSVNSYLEIDRVASKKISGLIRVFGTQNSKAVLTPGVLFFNPVRYNLNELKDLLGIHIKQDKKRKEKKNNENRIYTCKASYSLPTRRLHIIEQVFDKKYKNTKHGFRHNFCFMYFNYAIQVYDFDKAINKLQEFNRKFLQPMADSEIRMIVRSFKRKENTYKLKNDAFAERLGISESELAAYSRNIKNKNNKTSRKNQTATKKKIRDKKILDVFFSCGSVKNTAKEIGVCENTVRKVINKHPEELARLKRRKVAARNRRVFNNFLKYGNIAKAAKAGLCHKKTAIKIIKQYENLRQGINSMLARGILPVPPELLEQKEKHHNVFYKHEYLIAENIIERITGLDREDINIAIAPYIVLHD